MTERRDIQISLPSVGEEEWQALKGPISSGWLTQGAEVAAFEAAFAERHAVNHAIAVTSCTTGLHLALAALGVGSGDEVIVPAFTWVATANVVLYCGATPVFVDVDRQTYNIDTSQLASRLSNKTKAVIAVHLFGLPADVDAIRSVVPDHVKIVEDAACAAGAEYRDSKAGGLGDVAAFSFHPRKSITTGEGGMVTTNDAELAEIVSQLRNHGAAISEEQRHLGPKPYILPEFRLLGYNYRMTDMQGAIGRVQLAKLDKFLQERAEWAEYYRSALLSVNWLITPDEPENGRHAWQAFVCYVDPQVSLLSRNDIMERLQSKGIATRPGTHCVHTLNYYRERFGFEPDDFPVSRDCDAHTMAIPLHNRMSKEDYDYVIGAILEF